MVESKVRIFVVRPWKATGSAIPLRLLEDDGPVGTLFAGHYLCWEVPPRRITLTTAGASGNWFEQGDAPAPPLALDLKSGRSYYVQAAVDFGGGWHDTLQAVDAETGEKLLAVARPPDSVPGEGCAR